MRSLFFLVITFSFLSVHAQDLMGERIRKLTGQKKAVFLDRGIFHTVGPQKKNVLSGIRHSYKKSNGFERVVFDFKTSKIPKLYGHISGKVRRVYFDMFNTDLMQGIDSFGNSKYVEAINFFPTNGKDVSVEVVFKNSVSVDFRK